VPEPVEDASDSAWAEYRACCEAIDSRLAQLRAEAAAQAHQAIRRAAHPPRRTDAFLARELDLPRAAAPRLPAPPDAAPATLDEVLRLARLHGRICPVPAAWRRLYLLLPVRRNGSPARAPYPVDRLSWATTSELAKAARLREQLEWAAAEDALGPVRAFLAGLSESQWHHLEVPSWPTLAWPRPGQGQDSG
jgi:hypothetical protein